MTKKSNGNTNLKTFCITALSFYGVSITLFLMLALFWYTDFPGSWYMYDLCAFAQGFILTLCSVMSFLWLLITVIWCLVICKKEKSYALFRSPVILLTILSSIIYPTVVIPIFFL